MSNIKFYTEEQVKQAMLLYALDSAPAMVQVLNSLTPIELPSDEEIKKSIRNFNINDFGQAAAFVAGANWYKEQILNQNK